MNALYPSLKSCITLLLLCPILTYCFTFPTFIGPAFPAPLKLSEDLNVRSGIEKFIGLIEETLDTGTSVHGDFDVNSTAFSFEIFSTTDDDEEPIYQYHYSPPLLANTEVGVKNVDRDTIYRIGSVTKLYTVYIFLMSDGDVHFNDPITKYIPELLMANRSTAHNRSEWTDRTSWSDVTIGALASHMAGIGPECKRLPHILTLNSAKH